MRQRCLASALVLLLVCHAALALGGSLSSRCPELNKCEDPNLAYPNLEFAKYREQPWFHQINLSYPGLQLVNEEPYIFLVNNFLSPEECHLLIKKAEANLQHDGSNQQADDGSTKPGRRSSQYSIATNREVGPLRNRIASLARIDTSQIQPLKLSRYMPGDVFSTHSDAHPGAGPRALPLHQDSNNDGGRVNHGVIGDPRGGQNRFLTVLTFLNDVKKGGRTRFKMMCYDEFEPGGSNCTAFYKKPRPGHGRAMASGSSLKYHANFIPRQGSALVFFPSTTAETGGYTDYNTMHEAESPAKGQVKYVIQSFTWGLPFANFTKMLGPLLVEPKWPLTPTIV